MLFAASLALLWAVATPTAPTPATPQVVTVHLAGDSTMAAKLDGKRPETGWGEWLEDQFVTGTVHVDNRARNGRSTRTFIELGEWQALVDDVKPGDVVLIQFGHNDQSESKPDRYTSLEDYGHNLARFVTDVRERGGEPVLLTPVARRNFDADGVLVDSHGDYPQRMRTVAQALDVPMIDMQRRTESLLRQLGAEPSKAWFLWLPAGGHANYPQGVQDNTHFSPEGARRVAMEFARALHGLDIALSSHLKPAS